MKQSSKFIIGAFAAIGVVTTGMSMTSLAFGQGAKKIAVSQEKAEKATGAKAQAPMGKPHSNITPVQAMKAAEAKTGGKATMAIFEFDEGHWIYGVIVTKNHKLTEVDVDPMTGKAGATEAVTPEDEAKEMKDALDKMTM